MYNYTVQTLIDFTLGDGWLGYKSEKHKLPHFRVEHSAKQKEYAQHKCDILNDLGLLSTCVETKRGNWYTSSVQSEFAKTAHKYLYNKRRKSIDKALLREMNVRSLAYFFMDDGGAHIKRRKKLGKYNYIYEKPFIDAFSLATCSFTIEENNLLIDWLRETFSIRARLNILKQKYPRIVIDGAEAKNTLVCTIEPYIIPNLRYKIDKPLTTRGMSFEKHLYGERLNESGTITSVCDSLISMET